MLILFLQDVFLMIRRQKTTIFTDAKENTSVVELKRMIEGKCAYYCVCVRVCVSFALDCVCVYVKVCVCVCECVGVIPIYRERFDY